MPLQRREEFRAARLALVCLSVVGVLGVFFRDEVGCAGGPCDPESFRIGFEMVVLIVATVHLPLVISLVAEWGGVIARSLAALILLPPAYVVVQIVVSELSRIERPSTSRVELAVILVYGLAHLAQLWALSGIPFPRIQPVMDGSISSNLHTYAAPGAERNVAR